MCPGLLCFLGHSRAVSWLRGHCRGERDCWSPSGLRTGQLEQTKSCCTNSISLDFLASERKNSARWCPAQAADLHNNPLSTTPPDASFYGDLKGRWHPEGGQALLPSSPAFVWAAPLPGTLGLALAHLFIGLTLPDVALPLAPVPCFFCPKHSAMRLSLFPRWCPLLAWKHVKSKAPR